MHLNEPSNADNPLVNPINAQAVAESVEAGGLLQTAAAAIKLNIPKIEVTGPSDYEGHCLTCSFECKTEKKLDIHMANDHQVPMPLPIAVHPCGRPCNDCETKETVITAHIKKVERLELKITDLVTQFKMVKTDNVNLVKQKENRGKDYQEATRVIGDQQRKVTESTEKIIVLEGLAKVEAEKRVAKQSDEWEEVWEGDNTGNLVAQRRKEVELACKKCDKVLQSDQHMRQHIKEHTRIQNKLIMCHHCDFITNDDIIHTNHTVDVHSTKHTCQSFGAVFPTKSDMIKHARDVHGFLYNKNESAHK